MKIMPSILAGLSAALLLTIVAVAEPFNDRNTNWISTAPAGSVEANPPADVMVDAFNNRSTNWITTAPAGSAQANPAADAVVNGFNDRSINWITVAPADIDEPGEPQNLMC